MQQYFITGPAKDRLVIEDKETLKHMFQVMRLVEGQELVLVFDDGIKRLAKVLDHQQHLLQVLEPIDDQVELPVEVTIASGFLKGDKLDFVTQKATELGAMGIWAYPADWSVVKWDAKKLAKKEEKLEKIALGAAQQSKRNRLPQVSLFAQQKDFLAELAHFDRIWVAYEESAKRGEQSRLATELKACQAGEKILIIFGPEGGISPREVALFEAAGATSLGLGPRILRTETAPLYALSAISYALEMSR
ncbi:16S rRNA (uracil(1498)-N(3))-methyltransferase [Streptococcus ictaluri]|uniref:Ribosomal RNA small subunit methyltransferase E n=1 Tax=Streptococcus ictaluri 707-05 TaxID=764299 RepID=G5JZM9_9STRE|nr:16S rRNA (uracil(1498)-N(3))-methyltransferase [Streptococcus ictaluri]EHI70797.1 RNA methyltransferase, RsmE family [Streptococcus ictaluri 707-05]